MSETPYLPPMPSAEDFAQAKKDFLEEASRFLDEANGYPILLVGMTKDGAPRPVLFGNDAIKRHMPNFLMSVAGVMALRIALEDAEVASQEIEKEVSREEQ
jgi:hypothetical protein